MSEPVVTPIVETPAVEAPKVAEKNAPIPEAERAAILARGREKLGKPPKEAAKALVPAASTSSETGPISTVAAVPSVTTPTPKVPSPDDEAAERLSAIVREDRRIKADRSKLDADAKGLEAERNTITAVRAAREKKDAVGALRALGYTDAEIEEDVFFGLVNHLKPKEAIDPDSLPDLVAAQVDAKLAAKAESDAKARKAAGDADMDSAKSAYANECAAILKAEATKYPLVQANGVTMDDVMAHIHREYARTRQAPAPTDILAHFEAQLAKRAEAAGYAPRVAVAPATVPTTVNGAWTADSRAALAPPAKPDTLEQRTQRMRERARDLDKLRVAR